MTKSPEKISFEDVALFFASLTLWDRSPRTIAAGKEFEHVLESIPPAMLEVTMQHALKDQSSSISTRLHLPQPDAWFSPTFLLHPLAVELRHSIQNHNPDLFRRGAQRLWPFYLSTTNTITEHVFKCTLEQASLLCRLFISGRFPAAQPRFLDILGITHVICCYQTGAHLEEEALVAGSDGGLNKPGITRKRLVFSAVDDDEYDITKHFDDAIGFTLEALQQGPRTAILVHCKHGKHRSTAILASILVVIGKFTLAQALQIIKWSRYFAEPTESFLRKIQTWVQGK